MLAARRPFVCAPALARAANARPAKPILPRTLRTIPKQIGCKDIERTRSLWRAGLAAGVFAGSGTLLCHTPARADGDRADGCKLFGGVVLGSVISVAAGYLAYLSRVSGDGGRPITNDPNDRRAYQPVVTSAGSSNRPELIQIRASEYREVRSDTSGYVEGFESDGFNKCASAVY
eukprot:SAG31_NODE_10840_length_1092_cov_0.573011_1_plen_174_part_01